MEGYKSVSNMFVITIDPRDSLDPDDFTLDHPEVIKKMKSLLKYEKEKHNNDYSDAVPFICRTGGMAGVSVILYLCYPLPNYWEDKVARLEIELAEATLQCSRNQNDFII